MYCVFWLFEKICSQEVVCYTHCRISGILNSTKHVVGDQQIFVGMNELALDVPDLMHCWTYDWLLKKKKKKESKDSPRLSEARAGSSASMRG